MPFAREMSSATTCVLAAGREIGVRALADWRVGLLNTTERERAKVRDDLFRRLADGAIGKLLGERVSAEAKWRVIDAALDAYFRTRPPKRSPKPGHSDLKKKIRALERLPADDSRREMLPVYKQALPKGGRPPGAERPLVFAFELYLGPEVRSIRPGQRPARRALLTAAKRAEHVCQLAHDLLDLELDVATVADLAKQYRTDLDGRFPGL